MSAKPPPDAARCKEIRAAWALAKLMNPKAAPSDQMKALYRDHDYKSSEIFHALFVYEQPKDR